MQLESSIHEAGRLRILLAGDPALLRHWTERWGAAPVTFCVASICIGGCLYGAAMGCWRAPLQGLFVALKLPGIILLTTIGNALLNAMLAPLLGLPITVRQSFMAILMTFAIACAILGSFSPLVAFVTWNAPPMNPDQTLSGGAYSFIQLMHVGIIAFAGIAGNLRLAHLLRGMSRTKAIAHRVLFAWLVTNLFLGSQLSWILRPFIGSPTMPVQLIRATAFQGNFYEHVFRAFIQLLN